MQAASYTKIDKLKQIADNSQEKADQIFKQAEKICQLDDNFDLLPHYKKVEAVLDTIIKIPELLSEELYTSIKAEKYLANLSLRYIDDYLLVNEKSFRISFFQEENPRICLSAEISSLKEIFQRESDAFDHAYTFLNSHIRKHIDFKNILKPFQEDREINKTITAIEKSLLKLFEYEDIMDKRLRELFVNSQKLDRVVNDNNYKESMIKIRQNIEIVLGGLPDIISEQSDICHNILKIELKKPEDFSSLAETVDKFSNYLINLKNIRELSLALRTGNIFPDELERFSEFEARIIENYHLFIKNSEILFSRFLSPASIDKRREIRKKVLETHKDQIRDYQYNILIRLINTLF